MSAPSGLPTPAAAPRMHYRTCHLCEAMCGIQIQAEGDRIVAIRGDKDDPFSRGYICPKAAALADIQNDPDRLRHPMRRTASGSFVRVSWDEAVAEVGERLTQIQARHGHNAVAVYAGNPTVHSYGAMLFWMPFVRALQTRNRFSATSVDQLPHHLVAYLMYGHQLLLPIPDLDRTDFMLILGGNPAVSNGSLMSAPGVAKRLTAIRERGGQVVLIDPRRTETAALCDRHYFIRPGTDVLLMLALLHTLFAEQLIAPGRLAALVSGLATLPTLVAEFSPEVAAGPTGIGADAIRALARSFAAAKSAVCYGRMGVSTQEFGSVTQWLINVLNVVTGNLDRPGGAMFTRPAFDVVAMLGRLGERGHFDKGRTRVRKLPEYGGEYPVAALAEEILTPGPGQIRALITHAGNPVLSTPNGRALDEALGSLEFMVAIDIYRNETTRRASLILPPTFALEHDHYDAIFNVFAVRNTAKYSLPLLAPAADTRHDWEILKELTAAIEPRRSGLLAAGKKALMGAVTPQRLLALGLRLGPYGLGEKGVSLDKLKATPHGLDLGPLGPCLPERLFTPDRKIQLAPALLVRDLGRVRTKFLGGGVPTAAADGYDLQLIGRRELRSNNSWMHNSHRLVKGPPRCTLLIHPQDAAARRVAQGQAVSVRSRTGTLTLPAELSDEVMPGVVSIPHGWGHSRPGTGLQVAEQHAGVSINDLTDPLVLDELGGNAVLNGILVQVEAANQAGAEAVA